MPAIPQVHHQKQLICSQAPNSVDRHSPVHDILAATVDSHSGAGFKKCLHDGKTDPARPAGYKNPLSSTGSAEQWVGELEPALGTIAIEGLRDARCVG